MQPFSDWETPRNLPDDACPQISNIHSTHHLLPSIFRTTLHQKEHFPQPLNSCTAFWLQTYKTVTTMTINSQHSNELF